LTAGLPTNTASTVESLVEAVNQLSKEMQNALNTIDLLMLTV
jgi:hypothetical protein